MRRLWRVPLVVLAVPLLAYLVLAAAVGRDGVWAALFGPGDRRPVDFATLAVPDSPNRYLVCPPRQCPRADAESAIHPVPAERLRAAWMAVMERHGATVLSDARVSEGGAQIEAEVRTPWLRFPDLVTIRIQSEGTDRSVAFVYSRSLYGHSDMGVNEARVRAWQAEVEEALRTLS